MRNCLRIALVLGIVAASPALAQVSIQPDTVPPSGVCARSISADVIALDQPYFWNRLGAVQPHGMLYALSLDVVDLSGGSSPSQGNARLREEKRPRPLVLRMNVGDCLTINLTNYLHPGVADNEQVRTREVSAHVTGMQLVTDIADDGSWVGRNPGAIGSLIAPGQSTSYTYFAEREGTFLLHSAGALTSGEGDNGTISSGLFGAVTVEPQGSTWYRSQVTEVDLARTITGFNFLPRSDNGVNWIERYPRIDYTRVHPLTHPSRGTLPVLQMLHNDEIIYSDLTAVIVPAPGTYPIPGVAANPAVYPDRNEPFREFTIIFHDEPGAVQAFPHFYDGRDEKGDEKEDGLAYTLHSVRDAFAINYGTGGIGAEILANRLGVGPMHDCVNCLYEEFFLSSWAVGDPAMVVDVPANAPCDLAKYQNDEDSYAAIEGETGYCNPTPGPKATIAYFPEDPSNVYHSYLNDHVKFRNLLAGSDDHHVFHLHAHQWLHSPNEDESTYKDSQAIGQGTAFTYEIAFNGSGNRNKTPGDSIFHCHFYPHFAQGMWSMWRVHDVLELGTKLDQKGRPQSGARALPDGEIAVGTPIPGLVPFPDQAMAPPPSVPVKIVGGQPVINNNGAVYGNPGFPFYIPGRAGQRVPAPPLDVYFDGNVYHDGGLPRHLIFDADIVHEVHSRLDFSKELDNIEAIELDEHGEPWEQSAMRWHADGVDNAVDGVMATYTPQGVIEKFEINAAPEIAGAPYADPCGQYVIDPKYPPFAREYAAANIQMDVAFNTEGWHFEQQRFLSLWGDVDGYFNQGKDPEPLFIRANSGDCVTYLHTNLVPRYYEMDDFQVRTPTDVLGQHIHLVKFDVTASDGSANGFNYEDGTLSPQEVRHLIVGINNAGGILQDNGTRETLAAVDHPYFKDVSGADYVGAQTTVQRWYVDPILNNAGDNRSLRTVFTHDHFGPSTHQQVGLYAGLLTYKGKSPATQWLDAKDGTVLGNRFDGGPTTWNAVIRGPEDNFREFALEFGDFQLAYWPGTGYPDPQRAINPPGRAQEWDQLSSKPWIYEKPIIHGQCPNDAPPPCPEAVSADDPGTAVINYKTEAIALRVTDNPQFNPTLASAPRGDLSYAFSSRVHGDPDTPLLRAYEEDPVQMRVLVGAHEEEHNFSIHGARWLFEPSAPNSGYKSSQMMGISEFYDFDIQNLLGTPNPQKGFVDFLYKAGSSADDLWHGIWGLIRVYQDEQPDLEPVSAFGLTAREVDVESAPAAPRPTLTPEAEFVVNHASVCPQDSLPPTTFSVVAVAASQALPAGRLTYNTRTTGLDSCQLIDNPYPALDGYSCSPSGLSGPLVDPTAILFVRAGDLDQNDRLKPNVPVEPLILRARAGDCIVVNLRNALPPGIFAFDLLGYSLLPNIIDRFNQNQVPPSSRVGLHPTLLAYDGLLSDGVNVGWNPEQTVAPGQTRSLVWYAGIAEVDASGQVEGKPVEFGSVPLYSSDPIKHSNKGAVGALIIEPEGAKWSEYPKSRAVAIVDPTPELINGDEFREFVLIVQDDINLRAADGQSVVGAPLRPLDLNEDPTETGQVAFNYRTEPVWFRHGFLPETDLGVTRQFQVADSFSNQLIGNQDPQTPVFRAVKGENIRFRLIHPGGDTQQHSWGLHGHVWQETPWQQSSSVLGDNPASEWKGVEYGHGPTNSFDVLLPDRAGGSFQVTGDYMYRDYASWYLSNGLWGIFRVFDTFQGLVQEEPAWWTIAVEAAEQPAEAEDEAAVDAEIGVDLVSAPRQVGGGAQ